LKSMDWLITRQYHHVNFTMSNFMKTLVVSLSFLLVTFSQASELSSDDKPHNNHLAENSTKETTGHELAFNLPLALGGLLDITYQYWINSNLGLRLRTLNGYGLMGIADSKYINDYGYGVVLSKNILSNQTIYLFTEHLHSEIKYDFEDSNRQNEEYRDNGTLIGLGFGWGKGLKWSVEYGKVTFNVTSTTLSSGLKDNVFPNKYLAINMRFLW